MSGSVVLDSDRYRGQPVCPALGGYAGMSAALRWPRYATPAICRTSGQSPGQAGSYEFDVGNEPTARRVIGAIRRRGSAREAKPPQRPRLRAHTRDGVSQE